MGCTPSIDKPKFQKSASPEANIDPNEWSIHSYVRDEEPRETFYVYTSSCDGKIRKPLFFCKKIPPQ